MQLLKILIINLILCGFCLAEDNSKGIRISIIVLETELEAKNIFSKLQNGSKFSELASKYSIGPGKENNGDLGYFMPDDFIEGISEHIIDLKIGEYSNVINSKIGYLIILKTGEKLYDQDTNIFSTLIYIILYILAFIGLIVLVFFIKAYLSTPIQYRVNDIDDLEHFFSTWPGILNDRSNIMIGDSLRKIALIMFTKKCYKKKPDCLITRIFLIDNSDEIVKNIKNKLKLIGFEPDIKSSEKNKNPNSIYVQIGLSESKFCERILSLIRITLDEFSYDKIERLTISGSPHGRIIKIKRSDSNIIKPFALINLPRYYFDKLKRFIGIEKLA